MPFGIRTYGDGIDCIAKYDLHIGLDFQNSLYFTYISSFGDKLTFDRCETF